MNENLIRDEIVLLIGRFSRFSCHFRHFCDFPRSVIKVWGGGGVASCIRIIFLVFYWISISFLLNIIYFNLLGLNVLCESKLIDYKAEWKFVQWKMFAHPKLKTICAIFNMITVICVCNFRCAAIVGFPTGGRESFWLPHMCVLCHAGVRNHIISLVTLLCRINTN